MMKNSQHPPISDGKWMPVPGYDYLYASEDGRIWSAKSSALKVQRIHGKRGEYKVISVYDGKRKDKGRLVKVHRLVAAAFYGAPPTDAYTVDHINRNGSDNRVENLRWASPTMQAVNRDDFLDIPRRSCLLAKNIELLSMHPDFNKFFLDDEISILEKALFVLSKNANQ